MGLDGYAIEILPKIETDAATVRRNLVQMLAIARLVPHVAGGRAGLSASVATSLLDAYMDLYVRELAAQWRRGPIRSYRKDERNRLCLEGKLLFPQQMRQNLLRPDRFYTRADEPLQDVQIPRVLEAAVEVCRVHAIAATVQRGAMELLADFAQVRDELFDQAALAHVQVDRTTERFGPLLALAKLLLSGRTADLPGGERTYSLLFDMNVVFERYIGETLRRVVCPPALSADLQVSGKSLVRLGSQPKFRLRPDVGISAAGKRTCLLDTKWKRLDRSKSHNNVSQSDMYQAYAYGKEYGVSTVILLYPDPGGWPREVAVYRHTPGDLESPKIVVATVDLSGDVVGTRSGSVAAQLADLIPQAAEATAAA